MCFVDYTFLILGSDEQDEMEYLYWMKDGLILFKYRLHDEILYIAQNQHNPWNSKLIVSLGFDEGVGASSMKLVLKVWNF